MTPAPPPAEAETSISIPAIPAAAETRASVATFVAPTVVRLRRTLRIVRGKARIRLIFDACEMVQAEFSVEPERLYQRHRSVCVSLHVRVHRVQKRGAMLALVLLAVTHAASARHPCQQCSAPRQMCLEV